MAVWMVTGANRGIGLGLATRLVERGDEVIATARDLASADALDALAKRGKVTMLEMDVRDADSIRVAAAGIAGRPISVLVNNAGIYGPRNQSAVEVDPAAFLEVLDVNVVSPFRVLQAMLPNLRAHGPGAKVATISSSMGSLMGASSGYIAYRASKAAVNKAVQASAGELGRFGIISVVFHPGWVRTDMGGPNADLSVEQSTAGLVGAIDRLSTADTGRFLNWDGSAAQW